MIELSTPILIIGLVLSAIGFFALITFVAIFFSLPFEIRDTLNRMDDGQDDTNEILEEIRDAVKKKD